MLPPTPALTLALKSPNACSICHDDKPPRWADDHVRKWHGDDYQAPVLRRARLVDAARKGDWRRLDEMLACMDRGDLARALEEFEAATRLRPDAVPALVNAAMAYARMRRNADAERALRKALKAEPRNAAANFNMGLLQAELGQLSEAEERLRTALEADPRMALATLNLGVLLGQRGSAEAFAFLEKACELEPGEPRHTYTYAWFLSQGGRVDKAIGVLRDALDLHPTDAQTLFLAADLLERTGRRECAKEMLGRALDDASLLPGVRDAVEARMRALTGE